MTLALTIISALVYASAGAVLGFAVGRRWPRNEHEWRMLRMKRGVKRKCRELRREREQAQ